MIAHTHKSILYNLYHLAKHNYPKRGCFYSMLYVATLQKAFYLQVI